MREEQEREMLSLLQEKGHMKIEELAENLYVSPSTVRRKLSELQEKGLVTRTHGGVRINDENNFFPSFTFRSHQNSLEKKKIALAAVRLIKNGDLIFLDGSTSAFFIAEYLSDFKNIKVVTNGIDTLSLLSRNDIEAYSTGGYVSPTNRSVLIGHYAEEMIASLHADITFFRHSRSAKTARYTTVSRKKTSCGGKCYNIRKKRRFYAIPPNSERVPPSGSAPSRMWTALSATGIFTAISTPKTCRISSLSEPGPFFARFCRHYIIKP